MDNQPLVEIIETEQDWDSGKSEMSVYLNGTLVSDGFFGGEPEDNTSYRTYYWVVPLITKLANRLGAAVEHSVKKDDELVTNVT